MWANKTKISSQNFKLDPITQGSYLAPPEPPLSEIELTKIINAPIQHEPIKEQRIFDLPSAPIFYPTPQEFRDPAAYIASIREEGEKFGICKIVPPPSFRPKSNPQFKVNFTCLFNSTVFAGLVAWKGWHSSFIGVGKLTNKFSFHSVGIWRG